MILFVLLFESGVGFLCGDGQDGFVNGYGDYDCCFDVFVGNGGVGV